MKKIAFNIEGSEQFQGNPEAIAEAIVIILESLPVIEQDTARAALVAFSSAAEQHNIISNCTFYNSTKKDNAKD